MIQEKVTHVRNPSHFVSLLINNAIRSQLSLVRGRGGIIRPEIMKLFYAMHNNNQCNPVPIDEIIAKFDSAGTVGTIRKTRYLKKKRDANVRRFEVVSEILRKIRKSNKTTT